MMTKQFILCYWNMHGISMKINKIVSRRLGMLPNTLRTPNIIMKILQFSLKKSSNSMKTFKILLRD